MFDVALENHNQKKTTVEVKLSSFVKIVSHKNKFICKIVFEESFKVTEYVEENRKGLWLKNFGVCFEYALEENYSYRCFSPQSSVISSLKNIRF